MFIAAPKRNESPGIYERKPDMPHYEVAVTIVFEVEADDRLNAETVWKRYVRLMLEDYNRPYVRLAANAQELKEI